MRPGWNPATAQIQPMVFPDDYEVEALRGKPKGMRQVLLEWGLWLQGGKHAYGRRFLAVSSSSRGAKGCDKEDDPLYGKCCATAVLQEQEDFKLQQGSLTEGIANLNHQTIFYPKFHYELNFIERFWCEAKYFARENCDYSLEGL